MKVVELVAGAWRHRETVRQLVWRDLIERYRRSSAGVLLALLTPLLATLVLGVLFPRLMPEQDRHLFPFLVFAGYVAYDYLARVLAIAHQTLQNHAQLIGRVAFPIQVLPLATTLSTFAQFGAGLALLVVANGFFGSGWHASLALLPLVVAIELILVAGLALAVAAAGVLFRDYSHLQSLLLALLFYATPIFYDPRIVELESARTAIRWNPLTSIVDSLRSVIVAGQAPGAFELLHAGGCAAVALLAGSWLFLALRDPVVEELG